mgnify:CR=1 FL=1
MVRDGSCSRVPHCRSCLRCAGRCARARADDAAALATRAVETRPGVAPRGGIVVASLRAARGLGSLYAQSNEFTMKQAADFQVQWTPRGA